MAPLPAREPCKPGSLRPPGEKVCGSLRQRVPEVTGPSPPRDAHASPGGFLEGWPTLRVWGPIGGAVEGDKAGTAVLVKEEATPCHWENLTSVHPRSLLCPRQPGRSSVPSAGAEGWPWRGRPQQQVVLSPRWWGRPVWSRPCSPPTLAPIRILTNPPRAGLARSWRREDGGPVRLWLRAADAVEAPIGYTRGE